MIEGMINALNQIIIDESEKYEYQVADLSGIGTGGYLQSDRLHPNQRGQQMILERIKEQYYRK